MTRSLVHHHASFHCWQHSIEKGLHKKETKRWKAGLPLAGSIHNHCSSWERAFSTEGAKWRQGRFFLGFLLKLKHTHPKYVIQQIVERVNGFHLKRYICPETSTESPSPEDPMVGDVN